MAAARSAEPSGATLPEPWRLAADLEAFAVDDSHDVTGYADCCQVSSVCLTGQF